MRKSPIAALLLVLGGAGYLGFAGDKPSPFVTKARATLGEAGTLNLEEAADYWLAESGKRRAENNAQASGTALAVTIRLGRLEALRGGVKPIPEGLRRRFRDHFEAAVLDEARWTVAEPETRLGRILARWPTKEGALTLGSVVVFKTERASKDRGLFAHELVHV